MARNIGILATKEELDEMYWGQGMTSERMGELLRVTGRTVLNWLKKYGIARREFAEYHKGKPLSPEVRAKISIRRRKGSWETPSRAILEEMYCDKKLSLDQIARVLGVGNGTIKRLFVYYGITRRSRSKAQLGLKRSDSHKAATSRARKREIAEGRFHSPMLNPVSLRKMLLTVNKRPNRSECRLNEFLERNFPNTWLYNGMGEHLIIGGKVPDFININGRKAFIELYGDYWHKGENPKDRIAIFRSYGYRCLVIWEHELGDPEALMKRVLSFGNK